MDLSWINDFLPTFRCPHTHQPLRWALPDDLLRHGHPAEEKALVCQDGSRLYPIDQGIPVLLPQDAAK
ncbi:MAG: Trm112 family protein [Verrucomicrobiota bacterium]